MEAESLFNKMTGAHYVIAQSTALIHLAVLPTLITESDIVLINAQAHMSIQTAAKVLESNGSRVSLIVHNSIVEVEKTLKSNPNRSVWYLVDGIYSMYGDAAPLRELKSLQKKHPNLCLYKDDAHGFGCFGEKGRGYAMETIAPLNDHTIVVASLSKVFGCGGGIAMLPSSEMKQRVLTLRGPMVFGGSLQIPVLGGLIASAKIHLSDKMPNIQNALRRSIDHCTDLLDVHGLPLISHLPLPIRFVGCGPKSVAIDICQRLQQDGFSVNVACFPAVPIPKSGI